MALTPEQVKSLKEQLLSQIQNLPEDKKAEATKQINSLSPQALEIMLRQQKEKSAKDEGIFRLIVKGEIPSAKIDENASAIAVLEINPISKGHMIIIPKNPVKSAKEMPTRAFTLAKKLSKKIISKLKAKSTEIQTETKLGEMIINIIPIYGEPLTIESPRKKASKEELEALEKLLKVRKKPKIEKIKTKESKISQESDIPKLPRKIP
ncbi:MAG: HIT domain-containing protein [Candidatus Pacearchaeota archaeon]